MATVQSSVKDTASSMRFPCGHSEPEASGSGRPAGGRPGSPASGATPPWPVRTPRAVGAGSGKADGTARVLIDNTRLDPQNGRVDVRGDQLSRQWRLLHFT